MTDEHIQLRQTFLSALGDAADLSSLIALDQTYFSRTSGSFSALMKGLGKLPPEERKAQGQALNTLKNELMSQLQLKRGELEAKAMGDIAVSEAIDVTQPMLPAKETGHLHPNTQVQNKLEDLFSSMGFIIFDGPELETDDCNFTDLNIPPTHPARDSMDTFYVSGHPHWLMRTHTSPVQVRAPRQFGVPVRAVVPGRCFRNEATDPRHEHTFYQFDGVVIDKDISLSHMKGVLEAVAKCLYGEKTQVRMRPKFYPFVEPGVNGEVTCFLCGGKGCRVCKYTGWMEIFGAGPMHPHVLKAGGADPAEYTGFAFGFGLGRLVMLKYGIEDTRHFQSGDVRFLEQF